MSVKVFINKVLRGISIGVIIALVPPALIGELAKAFNLKTLIDLSSTIQAFLSIAIGVGIALQFKLHALQAGSVTIASAIGSGALSFSDGTLSITGLGDIINAGLTAAIAVLVILLLGNRLKAFNILLLPTIVIVISGLIGLITLPYVEWFTETIGNAINYFTTLQPVFMGILIAISFSILITSPISSVGIAVAIGLENVSAGAANIGAVAAGIGLAVSSFKANGLGPSTVLVLGSPKLQIINFLTRPKIMLPIMANAAVLGAMAGIIKLDMTTYGAGFGIVGLIGPLNYLGIVGYTLVNILETIIIFIVVPFILAIIFDCLLIKKIKLIDSEDYRIIEEK
ncbi:MAG: PTS transporter subunit IIC [Candidatus Woesearchaeota archaeon]